MSETAPQNSHRLSAFFASLEHATAKLGRFRMAMIVFFIAFSMRITIMTGRQTYQSIERNELVMVAMSVAEHGTFANAYGHGSGPTAHVAPLYPLLLSGIYRALGSGVESEIAKELLSILVASTQYGLLVVVAPVLGLSLGSGVLAGLGGALLPLSFWAENKGSFESPFTGLCLILLSAASARYWRKHAFRAVDSLRFGALAGVAMLLSPSVMPVVVGLLLLQGLAGQAERRIFLRFAAASLICAMVVVSPWVVRNYVVMEPGCPGCAPTWGLN